MSPNLYRSSSISAMCESSAHRLAWCTLPWHRRMHSGTRKAKSEGHWRQGIYWQIHLDWHNRCLICPEEVLWAIWAFICGSRRKIWLSVTLLCTRFGSVLRSHPRLGHTQAPLRSAPSICLCCRSATGRDDWRGLCRMKELVLAGCCFETWISETLSDFLAAN